MQHAHNGTAMMSCCEDHFCVTHHTGSCQNDNSEYSPGPKVLQHDHYSVSEQQTTTPFAINELLISIANIIKLTLAVTFRVTCFYHNKSCMHINSNVDWLGLQCRYSNEAVISLKQIMYAHSFKCHWLGLQCRYSNEAVISLTDFLIRCFAAYTHLLLRALIILLLIKRVCNI